MNAPVLVGLPYQLIDHPHQRLNQHKTFLGTLAHQAPDQNKHPNQPDVDISDDTYSYEIDIEMPGVQDPNSVGILWPTLRNLIITGTTTRSQFSDSKRVSDKIAGPSEGSKNGEDEHNEPRENFLTPTKFLKSGLDTLELRRTDASIEVESMALRPYLLHGERRIGSFRREFHFLCDIDMNNLSATLEAGLLHLSLPKKMHGPHTGSSQINKVVKV